MVLGKKWNVSRGVGLFLFGFCDIVCKIWSLQIINDRSTRGKCYGFVTFTNPRSAIDAINDMDGRVCLRNLSEVYSSMSECDSAAFVACCLFIESLLCCFLV